MAPTSPHDDEGGLAVDKFRESATALISLTYQSIAGLADLLTLTQFELVEILSLHGDRRLAPLARMLGITASHCCRELASLEAAGWVESYGCGDSDVPRRVTAHGRQLIRHVYSIRAGLIEDALVGIGPEVETRLAAGLTLLAGAEIVEPRP